MSHEFFRIPQRLGGEHGVIANDHRVLAEVVLVVVSKEEVRCPLEDDGDFRDASTKALSSAKVERDTMPAAGVDVEIFSLFAGSDTHFQDVISRVRAPVTYISVDGLRASDFWDVMRSVAPTLPASWAALGSTGVETARETYQALMLAKAVRAKGVTHLHAHFGTASTTVARLASRFAGVPRDKDARSERW